MGNINHNGEKMKIKILFILCVFLNVNVYAQEPKQHKVAWDPNPVEEQVIGYKIYLDRVYRATVTDGTEFLLGIGNTVPPGCWTVTAFNGHGLESDHSEQICRFNPEKVKNGKIEKKN